MAIISGTVNKDTLTGSNSKDTIVAFDDDDLVDARGGNDTVDGGAGNDTLFGGAGNDNLLGAVGADLIYGGAGNDLIGANDATRNGAGGGGAGDMIFGDGFNTYAVVSGTVVAQDPTAVALLGADLIYGTADGDTIYGDNGDNINTNNTGGDDSVFAGNGADTIYGEGGNDSLSGEAGDDYVHGGEGKDTFSGGDGNDTLIGGAGADVINGGNGDDLIVYLAATDSAGAKVDTISGFASGYNYAAGDKIDITALLGAGDDIQWNRNAPNNPLANGAWYWTVATGVHLLVDVTGDAVADLDVFLQGVGSLRHSDIRGLVNQAPVWAGDISNTGDPVVEAGTGFAGDPTAAGTIALGADPDGDSVTVTNPGVYLGVYGVLQLNGDGSWQYTLDNADHDTNALAQGQDALDTFSVGATDGMLSSFINLVIIVAGSNDAPAVSPATLGAIAEDSGVRLITQAELLSNASDVDSSLTAFNLQKTSGNGTLIDNLDGTWTYTPVLNDDTSVTFSYGITDGVAPVVMTTASLDIAPVNDAPVIIATSFPIVRVNTNSLGDAAYNFNSFGGIFFPDGNKIAFVSAASNLVPGDTNDALDIFVKDLTTGATTRVNTDSSGAQANYFYHSGLGGVSLSGSKIVFNSQASNFVTGDTNDEYDVFVKDISSGEITRVSVDAFGGQANGISYAPVFSPDSSKVAFVSHASNLVIGDTNGSGDIFIKDLVTGAITRVSTDSSGVQGNLLSNSPVFSPDGSKLMFVSGASNLVAGDTNTASGAFDIFVKDLTTGLVVRVNTDANGVQANNGSQAPVFSPDGTKVAFASMANNLVPGDTNSAQDIFVKDLITGTITRVSSDLMGTQANSYSYSPVFSPDGSKLAFVSFASNLVQGNTNFHAHVYVKDLFTGVITRVSTDSEGIMGSWGVELSDIVFSPDGTQVMFSSRSPNLVTSGALFPREDIYIKDLYGDIQIRTPSIDEDSATNPGTRIDVILSSAVVDADAGALKGAAITAADTSNGAWQYSRDNGTNWLALGAVSETSAQLLAADALLRFVPIADDWNGEASVQLRAWDQTSGVNGGLADVSVNGGATAFSAESALALLTVNAVNDAPVLTGDLAVQMDEGSTNVLTTNDLNYTDIDDDASGVTFRATELLNGSILVNGQAIGSFTGAQLANGEVSFQHNGSETTVASFKVSVDDGNEDMSVPDVFTFGVVVNPVNDAPAGTHDFWFLQDNNTVAFNMPLVSLLGNDSDAENNPLSLVSFFNVTGAFSVNLVDGQLQVSTGNVMDHEVGGFDYTVSDGVTTSALIHVTVILQNHTATSGADDLSQLELNSWLWSWGYLNALEGDDSLAGGAGNDILVGGADQDVVVYEAAGASVNVNLATGVASGMSIGTDTLSEIEDVVGSSFADVIVGDSGSNALRGGAGSDSQAGGGGNDVFTWKLGDQGISGAPAVDTIADFDGSLNPETDVLDLKDLLVGETANTLDSYLDFGANGTDTTINVKSTGDGVDQQIVLQGVNLTSIGNDQAIINALLGAGKLVVDL